jgi:hypothetical protein
MCPNPLMGQKSAALEWFALHIACAEGVGHVEISARISPILTGLCCSSAFQEVPEIVAERCLIECRQLIQHLKPPNVSSCNGCK